jgi:DNA-binding NarL/FixJ family response regulator
VAVRVFLLDDHELVRRGVRDLLWAEEDLTVVGEAHTADEALERIPQTRPDVAVLDVCLGEAAGDRGGIEVCREIRSVHPEVACVMLTSYSDDEALFASILAGAAGYVLTDRGGELDRPSTESAGVRACSTLSSPPGSWTACATSTLTTTPWPRSPRRSGESWT